MKQKQSAPATTPTLLQRMRGWSCLWLLPVIATLACAFFLIMKNEQELLWRAQELNLWLPTTLYWHTLMQYPGGAISWLGTFLTQFFYYPWLGTFLLCALWFIIALLTIHLYRLRGPWMLLSVLIPLAIMACFVQTGYWIYYQKLQGHLFVPTAGVLLALLSMEVYRFIPNRWAKLAWMVVVCVAGYPLFGAWALAATALLPTVPDREESSTLAIKHAATSLVCALALIAVVPQIFYQRCFEMTNRAYVYVAGMPSMRYGADSFEQYRLPYYAIIVAFLIVILVSWLERTALSRKVQPWLSSLITLVLVFAAITGVHKTWYRDVNFQKELAMYHAIEDLDWERVLTIAREGDSNTVKPTRQIVMFKNLALFRLGRAGNEMFFYPEGATQQNAPWRVHMAQIGGKLVYYHYGKENFCYRWCMEDGVEFGWKAETYKLMARNCLLNCEWEAARKYLNLLKK
nr:DUF6057 family protein [Bacteroidaceae bacterium]